MTQRSESLNYVEKLLIEFENLHDFSKKFDCFVEAMEELKKQLLNTNLSNDDKIWINKTKIAHTRIFLTQLPSIPPEHGKDFLFLLIQYLSEQVTEIISQDASLKRNFDELMDFFSEELSDDIERLKGQNNY